MLERSDKLNNQAIMLASDGAFNEAIACFKRAITIDNSNYLLWFNLGVTYRDSGNLEQACNALEAAAKIAPENEEVLETLATINLALRNFDKVQALCKRALQKNHCASHFWNLLGVIEFQSENYQEAAEFFEQAVYYNPYYLDGLYNLKDTYYMLKNANGEEECQKKITELEK